MHTIKISITINGTDAPSKETILNKSSNTAFLEAPDTQSILSTLINTVTAVKKEQKVYEFNYTITHLDADQNIINTIECYDFFDEVIKHDGLAPQIIAYTKATDHGEYDSRIWLDDETPAGTCAILALVTNDIKWIPEYITFLRTCDLDHEVDQSGDISTIVEQYGWCEATLSLAISRLFSCHGQHGTEDIEQMLGNGLSDFVQENNPLFAQKLKEELHYTSKSLSATNQSKKSYIDEIFKEDIVLFLDYLQDKTITNITNDLTYIWETINNK